LYDDLAVRRRPTFITLTYGVLVPSAHRFHYANAGHGPVLLHVKPGRGDVGLLWDDPGRGCPLGVVREPFRACTAAALEPGDLLVLGSDGLVETRRGGEQFGVERLGRILLEGRDRPLQELVEQVFAETTAFHEGPRPDDDLTLLMVRRGQ
jgi:sigma-B regulation protein RsbU (phosphoserine phosphatase)